jgi:RNA polymerase sigma-70 factor, ECF subfamily
MSTVLDARGARTRGVRARRNWCCGRRSSGTVHAVESPGQLLAARLAAGDDRALAEVIDALGPPVYAAAMQVLGQAAAAQDVVQEVFVDLWRQPQRYDPTLGTLRTYLTLSARHRAYDLLRSELRRVGREERHHRLVPPQRQATPGEQVVDALTASAVRDAIRALPPEQREVVEMAYFGGLSYRDVARAVGISEGTAKSRVRLALAKLENMLDRQLLESS